MPGGYLLVPEERENYYLPYSFFPQDKYCNCMMQSQGIDPNTCQCCMPSAQNSFVTEVSILVADTRCRTSTVWVIYS